MKNIFGLNKTLYGETGVEEFDGACFITKSLEAEAEVEEAPKLEVPKLPLPLSILQYVFIGMFAITLGLWLYSGKSLTEMIESSLYNVIIMAAGLLGFIAISIFEAVQSKKFATKNGISTLSELEEYEDIHDFDEKAEEAAAAKVKSELGIPESASDMDFLSFFYRENENGPFPIKPFDFMTMEMFAFSDGDSLCIADYNDVYSINKSDIKGIEKIEKETTLLGWSKDEPFDSEKYAEYEISENDEGFIVIPYYYSVRVDADGEEFELVIPPYELDEFKKIADI